MKSDISGAGLPPLVISHMDMFLCPACGGSLKAPGNPPQLQCAQCNCTFACAEGIPRLLLSNEWASANDVTEIEKSFYEKYPFPTYDLLDSPESLRAKARKGHFARLLDEQIPPRATICEIGCGTGQLSNFLGMTWGRTVFGTDVCVNSLRLGQGFKVAHQINNVTFIQMNLFKPVFKPDSFDLVICNGVLHHTSNPFLGFRTILNLVKEGGFIIIGLYNTFGRIPINIRRIIFKISGNRFKFIDPRLRDKSLSETRRHIWFMDQYKNPHESTHTFGEVLGWFDQSGVEFLNSIPKATAFEPIAPDEKLFSPKPRGTRMDHFFVQLGLLRSGSSEGGFFNVIGRRKG